MSESTALRVLPDPGGVRIWSEAIFGASQGAVLRELLARAFSVAEVQRVELQRDTAYGRICHEPSASREQVWKKLSRVLRGAALSQADEHVEEHNGPQAFDALGADFVFLDGPASVPVRVSRVGTALTTWHLEQESAGRVRLWHPLLRHDRALRFRLEEELAALYGVESFTASAWSDAFFVQLDADVLSAPRLATHLERAWPHVLHGVPAPLSRKRFFLAGGLLGLAFTGQYLLPALRPAAVLGAALYSSPNVRAAASDLKRGELGVSAMYTTGLCFMLITGMPFGSAVFAVLMQLWPNLGHQKIVRSQRRLFAAQRRRPVWLRLLQADGSTRDTYIADVQTGEQLSLARGDVVPLDCEVIEGSAAVVAPAALGHRIDDLAAGDRIVAGSVLRDGSLRLRVARGAQLQLAGGVDRLLPHTAIPDMPSCAHVERVANRNAKPALAASALSLLVTRTLRPSRALIRPDYVTAPRLSAQLSALYAVAYALQHAILFKRPAALDHLPSAKTYYFDDSAELARPQLEVANLVATPDLAGARVVQYALTARQNQRSEQSRALAAAALACGVTAIPTPVERRAGLSRFRDAAGSLIEVVSSQYLLASGMRIPPSLAGVEPIDSASCVDPALRPLWIVRNDQLSGAVSFSRHGAPMGLQLIAAIKASAPHARSVLISGARDADVQAEAAALGLDVAYGGLSQTAKAQLIRDTPRTSVWVGDGSQQSLRESIAVSTASISIAGLSSLDLDAADVLLPYDGLSTVPVLLELAQAHAHRLARDYRAVYTANLLGAAGAIVARLTSMQSGLLSNAATWLVYERHARALDQLAADYEATHDRLVHALHP